MKAIRIIGKLGNKSHYEYEEKDIKKIVGALSKEIEALRRKLSDQDGKDPVLLYVSHPNKIKAS